MQPQRFDFVERLRVVDERFAPTLPDFFVEEVLLVAAAARFVDLAELRDLAAVLRDLDAVLREGDLAALRADVFLAVERAALFAPPRAAVERVAVERAEVVREAVRFVAAFLAVPRAVDFAADLAGAFFAVEREAEDFAAVFLAPDLAADRVEDFAAVFRAVLLDADFAAVFLAPDFAAVLREADFVPLLRDEVPADFAADLRAVFVPLFLALDVPLFLLEELRRALLFFDLVLVAPESPVNSIVSGFDLSSVGIAASFKGLRVQPSRFEGNVVIPSGFRLTESVESKTVTFSVDTFRCASLSGLHAEREAHAGILVRSSSCSPSTWSSAYALNGIFIFNKQWLREFSYRVRSDCPERRPP